MIIGTQYQSSVVVEVILVINWCTAQYWGLGKAQDDWDFDYLGLELCRWVGGDVRKGG